MKFLTFLLPLSEPTHFFQLVLKKKSLFDGESFVFHISLKDYSIYLFFSF